MPDLDQSGKEANVRWDVRTALRRLGWESVHGVALKRGSVQWTATNAWGDSIVTRYDNGPALYSIEFTSEVPASVIVAACSAASDDQEGAREWDECDCRSCTLVQSVLTAALDEKEGR